MNLLDTPTLSRIRRNHGLEHATIHLLSRRQPNRSVAGHSDSKGFWLIGEVGTEELADTVLEALERMNNGEHHLAVHPNCGTNFVTYGLAAGGAAFLAMLGSGNRTRDRLERLPIAALFATIALILAQPLGYRIQQRITTSGHPGNLKIIEVRKTMRTGRTAHRVVTQG